MRRYDPAKPWEPADLNEIDRRVDDEVRRIDHTGWVLKLLTVGMLWALWERLGKSLPENLKTLLGARVSRDHAYGRRAPGGRLGQIENIRDVLPFRPVSRHMLRFALAHAAENVQQVSDQTKATLRMMLTRAQIEGQHPQELARRMREVFSGMNRDWRKIAVTESASIATNGYLGAQGEGQWVVGQSAADACRWCRAMIHGKIFTVTHQPPSDPDDPMWNTHLWPGKSNVGRVRHMRAKNGNVRLSNELWKPCIILHPSCRCRLVAFNPRLQRVDAGGHVQLV